MRPPDVYFARRDCMGPVRMLKGERVVALMAAEAMLLSGPIF
jgi:hypothetical protein